MAATTCHPHCDAPILYARDGAGVRLTFETGHRDSTATPPYALPSLPLSKSPSVSLHPCLRAALLLLLTFIAVSLASCTKSTLISCSSAIRSARDIPLSLWYPVPDVHTVSVAIHDDVLSLSAACAEAAAALGGRVIASSFLSRYGDLWWWSLALPPLSPCSLPPALLPPSALLTPLVLPSPARACGR